MRRDLSRLFLVLSLVGVAGCATTKTSDNDIVRVTSAEAYEVIGEHEQFLGLGGTRTGVWVDARKQEDYRAGHLPGAISVPIDRVRLESDRLDGYDTLLVYGEGYNSARAIGMSKSLASLGFEDVRILRGGYAAWVEAGEPVVEGDDPN